MATTELHRTVHPHLSEPRLYECSDYPKHGTGQFLINAHFLDDLYLTAAHWMMYKLAAIAILSCLAHCMEQDKWIKVSLGWVVSWVDVVGPMCEPYFTYLKISRIWNGVGPNHFGYERTYCTWTWFSKLRWYRVLASSKNLWTFYLYMYDAYRVHMVMEYQLSACTTCIQRL